MATLPAGYSLSAVDATTKRSQASYEHPYSFKTRVQDWGGRKRMVKVNVPPITDSTERDAWLDFFDDCDGMIDTFVLDIDNIYANTAPNGSVSFRMTEKDTKFKVLPAFEYGFSFDAEEVIV